MDGKERERFECKRLSGDKMPRAVGNLSLQAIPVTQLFDNPDQHNIQNEFNICDLSTD